MRLLFFFLILCSFPVNAQSIIEGRVIDAQSRKPLEFASVSVKNSSHGTNTNQDGVFKLVANSGDILLIQYLGYQSKTVSADQLSADSIIELKRKDIFVKEVQVFERNDFVYKLLDKSRKRLKAAKELKSKAYLTVETEESGKPIEMVECYYNGKVEGAAVRELRFKNGRVGLGPKQDGGSFLSLNSSQAISRLDLVSGHQEFPDSPWQFDKSGNRKQFDLRIIDFSPEDSIYHISFKPIKKAETSFSGEAWIQRGSAAIKKIVLEISNTKAHPFVPAIGGTAIDSVSFRIVQNFVNQGKDLCLSTVNFGYNFHYTSSINNMIDTTYLIGAFKGNYHISTLGVLYFYDFNNPFIDPYYQLDQRWSDYRKIGSQPYNEFFWTNASGLAHTARQMTLYNFFMKNGIIVNSRVADPQYGRNVLYESANKQWVEGERISIKNDFIASRARRIYAASVPVVQRYNLKAQIYMDLNESGGKLRHFTKTMFDVHDTYFDAPKDSLTDPLINIFFDLSEFHRRELEKILTSKEWTKADIDLFYAEQKNLMEKETNRFLHEVQLGSKFSELEKWNKLVYDRIGIDNLKLFHITPAAKN